MKSRTRNILIIVGIVALIIFGFVGYGIYSLYSFFSQVREFTNKEIPAELKEAKIFKGADFLTKSEFFTLKEASFTETVGKGATSKDEKERQKIIDSESAKGIFGYSDIKVCGNEIIAVGKFGGQVFDLNGNYKKDIYFEPAVREIKILWWKQKHYSQTLDDLRIVDLENDGQCEFISHGSIDGFAVFNKDGNLIWRYGERDFDPWENKSEAERDKEIYVTNAEILDLNGDGISEYIISEKNKGIHAFDINKNELWFQPDDFPTARFHLTDIDGDGKTELLQFQGMSSFIRDKQTGQILKKIEIDGWKKEILPFEKTRKVSQLFHFDKNKLIFSDFNNKVLLETEAPLSEILIKTDKSNRPSSTPIYMGNNLAIAPDESFTSSTWGVNPKAVWTSLKKDKPKYLAIIGSFGSVERSNFYVYDEKGNLVYHELLPEDAETIAAIPAANATEEIIIGGKNTIWKFTAK